MSKDLSNSKCQDILDTAKTLFWKHGVKRVSVQEICKTAGTSKMTFYRFFDNKLDLAQTLLNQFFEAGMLEYDEIMAQDISFAEKVQLTIQSKIKNSEGISQEMIKDIYSNQELGLLAFMEEKAASINQRVLEDYSQAQKDGYIRSEIKLEFVMYQMNHLRQMMKDEYLINLYEHPQELITEITTFFFKGILTDKQ